MFAHYNRRGEYEKHSYMELQAHHEGGEHGAAF